MLIVFLVLFTFHFEISENLMAYDSANQFLNIPHNEIHVITDAIDNYKPNLRVRFINFQTVKRRRTLTATQIKDGLIRIENKSRPKIISPTPMVENVRVENEEKIELRFGGGSKAHFPYNRVVDYYGRHPSPITTTTTTTTTTPTPPPITPRKWAASTTTSIAPNYSAQPALYLPSRFSQRKENIVIVYKKN